ncbi:hypothetical protein [Ferruginibacter sp. SUN106]|uniref:hypothetical protein n=1 Tax=Ferruginibacter sp. SUN106 TaxID=2978348 RepID=UPI003D36312A
MKKLFFITAILLCYLFTKAQQVTSMYFIDSCNNYYGEIAKTEATLKEGDVPLKTGTKKDVQITMVKNTTVYVINNSVISKAPKNNTGIRNRFYSNVNPPYPPNNRSGGAPPRYLPLNNKLYKAEVDNNGMLTFSIPAGANGNTAKEISNEFGWGGKVIVLVYRRVSVIF